MHPYAFSSTEENPSSSRQQLPVNGETGRCGNTGSQGALIHRLVGTAEANEIALQKLNGSHEIVRQSRWLRELRVSDDREESVDMPAGQFQQQVLKRTDLAGGLEQLLAQNHSIKRDVDVIAAASNAQMPGDFAPTKGFEPSLDVKEQVFFDTLIPVRKQLLLVAGDLLQRFKDSLCMGPGDDAATGQHDGVRPVDLDQRLKKVANRMFEIGLENGLKVGRMGKAGRR